MPKEFDVLPKDTYNIENYLQQVYADLPKTFDTTQWSFMVLNPDLLTAFDA